MVIFQNEIKVQVIFLGAFIFICEYYFQHQNYVLQFVFCHSINLIPAPEMMNKIVENVRSKLTLPLRWVELLFICIIVEWATEMLKRFVEMRMIGPDKMFKVFV